jgi:tRNA (guanosine-2'-O-)-methyltransferase
VALVLDRLGGPFNVGSILRTAAAFTVDHLWIVEGTIPPDHAKVAKTALGSERYLTWSWVPDVAAAAAAARADGYGVVALELTDDAVPLPDLAVGGATCVVVGHEDRGLSPAGLEACDAVAFIPQLGRIGSLNVATATSIALYDVRRRSWPAAEPAVVGAPAAAPAAAPKTTGPGDPSAVG